MHAAFNGHTDVMNRLIMAGAKREAAENLDDPSIPALYWGDTKRKVVEKKCAHCRSFFFKESILVGSIRSCARRRPAMTKPGGSLRRDIPPRASFRNIFLRSAGSVIAREFMRGAAVREGEPHAASARLPRSERGAPKHGLWVLPSYSRDTHTHGHASSRALYVQAERGGA